jgi:hypothetical protein
MHGRHGGDRPGLLRPDGARASRPPGLGARVADIPEPGKNNAWNRFVHEFSAREARYICLMDADIIFDSPTRSSSSSGSSSATRTWGGASDCPRKRHRRQGAPFARERLSLAASDMTDSIEGRLNGMLYCLRAGIARNFYLPRDLGATDDGFFKAAICTDFFRAPVDPSRVVSVRAPRTFTSPTCRCATS